MTSTYQDRYDVVVVGARCAGASTAMLLAERGLRVLAVEQGRYGSDTLSTLALMRGGVLQLHRWNVLPGIEAAGTPVIRKTSFHYGDDETALAIKPRHGIQGLYAPRRSLLDRLLVDRARAAGAEVVHGVRVVDLLRSPRGRVEGVVLHDSSSGDVSVRAGMVIGADGVRSAVARLAQAKTTSTGRNVSGVVFGFWEGLHFEGFHWHFRRGVSAGVIPTNDGRTLVFAATPQKRFLEEIRFDREAGFHRVIAETAPALAEKVAGAARVETLHGFAGIPGFFRQSYGPGWALVGDAGYFKDPITAHGITDALRDAELLARAVALGSDQALADYQETRDELSRGLFEATEYIATYDWTLSDLQKAHLEMSEEMNREVEYLLELDRNRPEEEAVPLAV